MVCECADNERELIQRGTRGCRHCEPDQFLAHRMDAFKAAIKLAKEVKDTLELDNIEFDDISATAYYLAGVLND